MGYGLPEREHRSVDTVIVGLVDAEELHDDTIQVTTALLTACWATPARRGRPTGAPESRPAAG